jgi:hypothetical protein
MLDPKINLKRYKKVDRSEKQGGQMGEKDMAGKKRRGSDMEIEEETKKKRARDNDVEMNQTDNVEAGLSEQLRG